MKLRRVPTLKRWLFGLWIDLERCLHARNWNSDRNLNIVEQMVVLLEDRRFLSHPGIDLRSIARVVLLQLAGRRRGGASTIEMQFVRTVTGRYERTLARKVREALLGWILSFHMEKQEILRSYLSVAYFGRHTTGIDSASQRLFQKWSDDLTVAEAAVIASLLVYPAPGNLNNIKWKSKLDRRAKYGLKLWAMSEKRSKDLTN